MHFQVFVADAIKLDAHPAGHAHVWRSVVFPGRGFDQRLLDTDRRRHNNRDVPVVVMVVGTQGKYVLSEEGRFAARDFFRRPRQGETNAPNSFDLLLALIRLLFFR